MCGGGGGGVSRPAPSPPPRVESPPADVAPPRTDRERPTRPLSQPDAFERPTRTALATADQERRNTVMEDLRKKMNDIFQKILPGLVEENRRALPTPTREAETAQPVSRNVIFDRSRTAVQPPAMPT